MTLKNGIRWILCIPSSTAALLSVYGIAQVLSPVIGSHAILRSVFFQVTMGCLASFISAFLFVAAGALMAPANQMNVARVLAFTFILLSILKIQDLLRPNLITANVPWLFIILATLTGISGAMSMLLLFQSRLK